MFIAARAGEVISWWAEEEGCYDSAPCQVQTLHNSFLLLDSVAYNTQRYTFFKKKISLCVYKNGDEWMYKLV